MSVGYVENSSQTHVTQCHSCQVYVVDFSELSMPGLAANMSSELGAGLMPDMTCRIYTLCTLWPLRANAMTGRNMLQVYAIV